MKTNSSHLKSENNRRFEELDIEIQNALPLCLKSLSETVKVDFFVWYI